MATRQSLKITESRPFAGARVDRAAGIVHDALICGSVSENGRDYPWGTTLQADSVAKYEGRPVYLNHSDSRIIEASVGWFEKVKAGADGRPRGEFHVLLTHPYGPAVLERAARKPDGFGMSHVADCRTSAGPDGRLVVEGIDSVESIDLVCDPATTKGLFESVTPTRTPKPTPTRSGTAVKTTLTKFMESLPAKMPLKALLKLRRLGEMDGMGESPVDPPDDAAGDPDAAVDAAFSGAMHAQLDAFLAGTMDAPEMLKKLKALMKAHGDVTDDDTPAEKETPADDTPAEESKKQPKSGAIMEAINALRAAGSTGYTTEDIEIVAATPAGSRPAIIKRLMASASASGTGTGETPRSQGRAAVTESIAPPQKLDLAAHW